MDHPWTTRLRRGPDDVTRVMPRPLTLIETGRDRDDNDAAMSPMTRGPGGRPIAFEDLPAAAFPVRITGLDPVGVIVWERTIEPYVLVKIPAAPPELVGKVTIRIEYATGEVHVHGPMSPEECEAHIERSIRASQDDGA